MTYAHITNNNVVNIISAEEHGAASLIAAGMQLVQTDKPIAIGDTYDGTTFFRGGVEVLSQQELQAQLIATYEAALTGLGVLPLKDEEMTDDAE